MKVTLRRVSGACFEAVNEGGQSATIDGPPAVGGQGLGVRPMEMVLMGLAGCAAMDVLLIMDKQRQPLSDLQVHVEAERADAVPAVFTAIVLTFEGSGAISEDRLERAVKLSLDKYCSVARMLESSVTIRSRVIVKPDAGPEPQA